MIGQYYSLEPATSALLTALAFKKYQGKRIQLWYQVKITDDNCISDLLRSENG
jgi:hypothetical protein